MRKNSYDTKQEGYRMSVEFKPWFDTIIHKNLEEKGLGPFGYAIGAKNYPLYYNRDAFTAFLLEMGFCHPQHYNRYINGQGSELLESNAPPKMASVASSSRFAYLALRWGAQAIGGTEYVEFEHECKIHGIRGTAPQLDAYTTDKNGNPIFIEVKCHEIFDPHKIELKAAYWDSIYGENNAFGFRPKQALPSNETFRVPLSKFGIDKEHSMMDIQQLLCHLMGIASQKESKQPASLVYLFFRPTATGNQHTLLDGVFARLNDEIDRIFNSKPIKTFCFIHRIDLKVVVEEASIMERLSTSNIAYVRDFPHK